MSAMYAVGALLAGAAEVKGRWGTDPAKRAFYRAFRELCLAAVPESGCFRAGAMRGVNPPR